MKTIKKVTLLFLFATIVFSCSDDDNNNSGCQTCTYTINSNETAATTPTNLQKEYNVIVDTSVNGYEFAKGTTGKFNLEANKLTVTIDGNECLTMVNPKLSTNGGEVIFTDNCNDNVTYNISGSSTLNEINVISISGTFLASIKAQ